MTTQSILKKLPSAFSAVLGSCLIILFSFGTDLISVYAQTPQPTNAGSALPTSSAAQQPHNHSSVPPFTNRLETNELLAMREVTIIAVPDLELTDQDGRQVKLYDGLMKGKLVVLNFFYTTCVGPCPTTGLWLSKLQEKLGERQSKDVIIVSISIDPQVDTPEKIKQWAAHWKRKQGWTLLTSKSEAVSKLSRQFLSGELKGMHSPVVFVGDARVNPIGWINVDILDESRLLLGYFEQMKSQ